MRWLYAAEVRRGMAEGMEMKTTTTKTIEIDEHEVDGVDDLRQMLAELVARYPATDEQVVSACLNVQLVVMSAEL